MTRILVLRGELRRCRWGVCRPLRAAPVILVVFDGDEPDERASSSWLDALPEARGLVPNGDAAEMLEAGADLRAWVREALS